LFTVLKINFISIIIFHTSSNLLT